MHYKQPDGAWLPDFTHCIGVAADGLEQANAWLTTENAAGHESTAAQKATVAETLAHITAARELLAGLGAKTLAELRGRS